MRPMLDVRNLKTYFYTSDGVLPAVDDVSFDINEGETLCVVGESGCGKSVTALSIMGLIPSPPGKVAGGEIIYNNEDLLKKSKRELQQLRGNDIAMIFQEPMTSLNPVYTVGNQISEVIKEHRNFSGKDSLKEAERMLALVGIPDTKRCLKQYPHELSGGMCQRVMISIALICQPRLLIADEPTTALDVTIQAQILDLMRKLKDETSTSIMLITHDLGGSC